MMFNGLLKVPMQFFILLVGVMVFVFYQFNPAPLNFIDASTEKVLASTPNYFKTLVNLKTNWNWYEHILSNLKRRL